MDVPSWCMVQELLHTVNNGRLNESAPRQRKAEFHNNSKGKARKPLIDIAEGEIRKNIWSKSNELDTASGGNLDLGFLEALP